MASRRSPEERAGAGRRTGPPSAAPPRAAWTFLTNHAHVFISVAVDPTVRVRDLALRVGITERAVQRILRELEEAGYVTTEKDGRRNVYRVKPHLPFRHPIERHQKVGVLLRLFGADGPR